jgi:hypothetical protein
MIESILPTPPAEHHYEVEVVSKMVRKVWLVRNNPSQLLEKDIRTIYCFIKGSKTLTVHKPMNADKCYVKKFCELDELSQQPPFSLFIPKVTKLFD